MRSDIVHHVYGVREGRTEDTHFGTYRTAPEAAAAIERLYQVHGREWAAKYHDRGFVIREATVETDFELPSRPTPREKYVAIGTDKPNAPGTWPSTLMRIYRRGPGAGELIPICEYERGYAMLQTFEPFRQGGRDYALISRDYTLTAVLDLTTGQVIAEEADPDPGGGFCPVGFYVPDWWDVHDGSIIPGSPYWKSSDHEWPSGAFGFVWGCIWGDESSWKVQHLDLRRIADGVITREERFGYVELATTPYEPPCLNPEWRPTDSPAPRPPPFIQVSRYEGKTTINFSVQMKFDLDTGANHDWQRTRSQWD